MFKSSGSNARPDPLGAQNKVCLFSKLLFYNFYFIFTKQCVSFSRWKFRFVSNSIVPQDRLPTTSYGTRFLNVLKPSGTSTVTAESYMTGSQVSKKLPERAAFEDMSQAYMSSLSKLFCVNIYSAQMLIPVLLSLLPLADLRSLKAPTSPTSGDNVMTGGAGFQAANLSLFTSSEAAFPTPQKAIPGATLTQSPMQFGSFSQPVSTLASPQAIPGPTTSMLTSQGGLMLSLTASDAPKPSVYASSAALHLSSIPAGGSAYSSEFSTPLASPMGGSGPGLGVGAQFSNSTIGSTSGLPITHAQGSMGTQSSLSAPVSYC